MKVLLSLLAALSLLAQSAEADVKWQEAKDYELVSDHATAKPQVLEFFSFWCPHCYHFESTIKALRPKLAAKGITLDQVHVDFMPFTSKALQDDATTAMMVGRVLQRGNEMNKAIFDYLNADHGSIEAMNDLQNLFIVHDIDGDKFTKLVKSQQVAKMVADNNRLFQHYHNNIDGTPTVIVNGKYKALFTQGQSEQQRVNLILWLASQH